MSERPKPTLCWSCLYAGKLDHCNKCDGRNGYFFRDYWRYENKTKTKFYPCKNCDRYSGPIDINEVHKFYIERERDSQKVDYGLLPPRALQEVVLALQSGIAGGRTAYDWAGDKSRFGPCLAAATRHLEARRMGVMEDKCSGLNPLAHVAARALMALAIDMAEPAPEWYCKDNLSD